MEMEARNSRVSRARTSKDRISELSDTILQHIRSFLDTKYAVQTSVLSKRWSRLSVSLPFLSFNSHDIIGSIETRTLDKEVRFKNFIDQAFVHRDGSNLQKFCLVYDGDTEMEERPECDVVADQLCSWVLDSIKRNVEELDLTFSSCFLHPLPLRLFSCTHLKVLKLKTGYFGVPFKLPNSIALPSLKILHLHKVYFREDINSSEGPFSKCPVLESLFISSCYVPERKTLYISIPTLKHLRLDDAIYLMPMIKFIDAVSLIPMIKLNTPNLVSFAFSGRSRIKYPLEGLPSVVSAEIGFTRGRHASKHLVINEDISQRMTRFLRVVHNVKTLTLSEPIIEILSGRRWALKSLSRFLNLRRMDMQSTLSAECGYAIMCLLDISPNVETLILEVTMIDMDPNSKVRAEGIGYFVNMELQETGNRTLHHLKHVRIRSVLGWKNELKFMEILLKKALVLEKMDVSMRNNQPPATTANFRQTLENFPRASPNAAIKIF